MTRPASQPLSNLPSALNSFIGREREIAEVERLLGTTRLLTLTGPGGCGKTRLALQVAQQVLPRFAGGVRYDDGVWLTEFAPLADPGLVPQAVAVALGVHEQPGRSLADTLIDHLAGRQALLLFDNCEHLAAACAGLAEALLRACPGLRLLATSRETLNLAGETSWVVPPLSLPLPQPWRGPASPQTALPAYQQSEAVRLFVDRALAASPGFTLSTDSAPWVAEICRRLEGMPLAIELAAARVRALSVQEIAARLGDRFHLLTGGSRTAPPRQQSLEATLDWSFSLLSAGEQQLLLRLSVFAGGWGLSAAESVGAGGAIAPADVLDLLSRLVDKSLVQAGQGASDTRFHMLETIRQYAQRKLAELGDTAEWRNRHLNYFIRWAEQAEPHLDDPDQVTWWGRFEAEHDNLRAALAWALAAEDRANQSLRLAGLAGHFWRLRGYTYEGRARLAAALAQPGADRPEYAAARLRVLLWASVLAFAQSDYPAARAICQARLALCRELGAAGRHGLGDALETLAEVDTEEGDYAAAGPGFEQALSIYEEVGDRHGAAHTLTMIGWLAMRTGDYETAAARFDEALARCRAFGDPVLISQGLAGRGELAVRQGQYSLAAKLLEESLVLRRQIGEGWGIAISLGTLGWIALRQHDFRRMRERLGESLAIRLDSGDAGGSAWCLERLAEAALLEAEAAPPAQHRGGFQRAARLFAAAAALRARLSAAMDAVDQPEYEHQLAILRAALGEPQFAAAWDEGAALTLPQATEYALETADTAAQARAGGHAAGPDLGGLSARERQVAVLIAQGQSNRKIAETMVVSVKTVETYVTRILNKLGCDSRVQIATWAIETGLAPRQRD